MSVYDDWRRNSRWLPRMHLAVVCAMFGTHAAGVLAGGGWLTAPLGAMAWVAAFSIMHEAAHGTYFASPRANRLAGRIAAAVWLNSFTLYRRDHALHHAWQGRAGDTEIVAYITSRTDLLRALFFNANLLLGLRDSLTAVRRLRHPDARRESLGVVFLLGGAAALTLADPIVAVELFWLPFSMASFADSAISLPEHATIGRHAADRRQTRSLDPGRIGEFLLYWVNRHVEHHDDPARSVARTRIAEPRRSYLSFYLDAWSRCGRKNRSAKNAPVSTSAG